jgi:hypothetical protein
MQWSPVFSKFSSLAQIWLFHGNRHCSWLASTHARQWEPPPVLIRDVLLQMQPFHQIPNMKILS